METPHQVLPAAGCVLEEHERTGIEGETFRRSSSAAGVPRTRPPGRRVSNTATQRVARLRCEVELNRVRRRVEQDQEALTVGRVVAELHAEGAAQAVAPVAVGHLAAFGREPVDVLEPVARHGRRRTGNRGGGRRRSACASRSAPARSARSSGSPLRRAQFEPADLVVLAVGVVVAALRARELVAHQQHRHALRKQQRRQQVALLPARAARGFRDRRSGPRRRQFQDRLWLWPSLLSSPFASLWRSL